MHWHQSNERDKGGCTFWGCTSVQSGREKGAPWLRPFWPQFQSVNLRVSFPLYFYASGVTGFVW